MKLDTSQGFLAVILVFMLSSIDPASSVGPPLSGRYDGYPKEWCYTGSECDQEAMYTDWKRGPCREGTNQSPIKLVTNKTNADAKLETTWGKDRANYKFTQFKMENNGRTVMLSEFKAKDDKELKFSWEENDNNVYQLEQIHFHWGEDDKVGSEHYVKNKSYSMEMHLVHFKADGNSDFHPNFGKAVESKDEDALVVIGVFLNVGKKKKTNVFKPVIDNLPNITAQRSHTTVNLTDHPFDLSEVLADLNKAFRYYGSLTTPGCNQNVAWFVCKTPVNISSADVKAFRELIKYPEELVKNYRKLQELNEREVELISFKKNDKPNKKESSIGTSINTCLSTTTIIIITSVQLYFNM